MPIASVRLRHAIADTVPTTTPMPMPVAAWSVAAPLTPPSRAHTTNGTKPGASIRVVTGA